MIGATGRAVVPEPIRPDVLSYPSPTTIRAVVLVVAALSAGLFAGTYVHNTVEGANWQRRVQTCLAAPADSLGQQLAVEACTAGAERRRGAYALAGLAVGALAGLIVLGSAPAVIERRRRLRPVSRKFGPAADQFARLASAAGLARPPTLMIGPAAQRDAFSYGLPHRYRVVLPVAVLIRPGGDTFRALAAHELAHVRHRDVTVAWLARSVGYAVVPVLAVPLVLAVATADLSEMVGYLGRSVLLVMVIILSRAAILRSREHDADLRAARHGSDVAALSTVLASARDASRPGRRRMLANHPPTTSRIAVLGRPAGAARVGFVDGLTAAFLVGLLPPLIDNAVIPLLTGTTEVGLTNVVSALLIGPLAGGTLGLALWRAALLSRLSGEPVQLGPVVAGVFVGYVAGSAASLAQYGSGLSGIFVDPLFGIITAAAVAGATVTTAGLGELWAGAAGRIRSARASWSAAILLPGALFAVVAWVALTTAKVARDAGWDLVRQVLPEYFSRGTVVATAVLLAAAAAWALWAGRPGGVTPQWLLESGPRYEWPTGGGPGLRVTAGTALGASLAGVAVLVGFRMTAGPFRDPASGLQRFDMYVLFAVGAGVAATLALTLGCSAPGAGAALLAVPLATTLLMIGFIVSNSVYGGPLTPRFVSSVLEKPFGLALPAEVLVSAAALATAGRLRARRLMPVATAAVLAAATAIGVIGARNLLLPMAPPTTSATSTAADSSTDYRDRVAPPIYQAYSKIIQRREVIATADQLSVRARASDLDQDVLQPLQTLDSAAEQHVPADTSAQAVHARCLLGLRDLIEAARLQVYGLEHNDQSALRHGQNLWVTAIDEMRDWYLQAQTL